MDNAFQDFLNDISSSEDEVDIDELTNRLLDIKPEAKIFPAVEQPASKVDEYYNILNEEVAKRFETELPTAQNAYLTQPKITTITLGGMVAGVEFREEEIINRVEPTPQAWLIECNYGKKEHPRRAEMIVEVKKDSNRGRKAKAKAPKKERKKQGTGTCFASCISINVAASNTAHCEYKFKIFRNGAIQIPGAKTDNIADIMLKTEELVNVLKRALESPDKIELSYLCPYMKNFKFQVQMRDEQIVDLNVLKNVLQIISNIDNNIESAPNPQYQFVNYADYYPHRDFYKVDGKEIPPIQHPRINSVIYTTDNTKLRIKLHTPIKAKEKKETSVAIYMSGKINIKGAYDDEITIQIYNFVVEIFRRYGHWILRAIEEDPNDYVILMPTLTD